jgi:hypothetical protein
MGTVLILELHSESQVANYCVWSVAYFLEFPGIVHWPTTDPLTQVCYRHLQAGELLQHIREEI